MCMSGIRKYNGPKTGSRVVYKVLYLRVDIAGRKRLEAIHFNKVYTPGRVYTLPQRTIEQLKRLEYSNKSIGRGVFHCYRSYAVAKQHCGSSCRVIVPFLVENKDIVCFGEHGEIAVRKFTCIDIGLV